MGLSPFQVVAGGSGSSTAWRLRWIEFIQSNFEVGLLELVWLIIVEKSCAARICVSSYPILLV